MNVEAIAVAASLCTLIGCITYGIIWHSRQVERMAPEEREHQLAMKEVEVRLADARTEAWKAQVRAEGK